MVSRLVPKHAIITVLIAYFVSLPLLCLTTLNLMCHITQLAQARPAPIMFCISSNWFSAPASTSVYFIYMVVDTYLVSNFVFALCITITA